MISTPVRAFKFVSTQFADDFARAASIQVGSFAAYRELETARGDDMEGVYGYSVDAITIGRGQDEEEARAEGRLRDFLPPFMSGVFVNAEFRYIASPHRVFCMSVSPDAAALGGEGALFQISDVRGFAALITAAAGGALPQTYKVGDVSYRSPLVDPRSTDASFNPFVKTSQFASEQEVRIVWESQPEAIGYIQLNAPLAAHLIHRIY